LVGGALAAVGGVVLMGYDWKDARAARQERKQTLSRAYSTRFAAGLAILASQSSIAFAAAGPMFRILAERAARATGVQGALGLAAAISSYLGRPAVLLFMRNVLLRSALVGLVATLAICIFDDDALEKWCKRCLYRGYDYHGNPPFREISEELSALYSALLELL
ncbi:hypothetical protein, partial [Achromobacter spanius]|uniref:hypothetical protein n=1 Tax=Achromobacter spanius TaxID=217203 RepID=UPI001CB8F395